MQMPQKRRDTMPKFVVSVVPEEHDRGIPTGHVDGVGEEVAGVSD